jgi:DNA primase catalytic core
MLISKADIDAVKAKHDLVDFIAGSGVPLKKQGRYFVAPCPFHSPDKTPSLVIDPAKQLWNCLGACTAGPRVGPGKGRSGGDLFAFAMKLWSCDFREAYVRLGGVVRNEMPPPRRKVRPPTEEPRRRVTDDALVVTGRAPRTELFCRVVEHCHGELSRHVEAQQYLESRGLRTRALWRVYRLGYSSGSLETLAGEDEESPVRRGLISMGILTQEGEERMKGRVIFPLFALNQLPIGLYGRAITKDLFAHNLLPGARRGLFNQNAGRRSKELIVVEATISAASLVESGVHNAIPLFGVNGFCDDHSELIRRFDVKSVVVALDSDETGRRATPHVCGQLQELGVKVRAIEWPEKDPNELLVKHGPEKTRQIVEALLSAPKPRDLPRRPEATDARDATVREAVNPPFLIAPLSESSEGERAVKEESSSEEISCAPEAARESASPSSSPSSPLSKDELLSDSLTLTSAERLYRIAWTPGCSSSHLRATVRVRVEHPAGLREAARALEPPSFIDSLDLVLARARESFAKRATRAVAASRLTAGVPLSDDASLVLQRSIEADLSRLADIGEERRKALESKEAVPLVMSELDRKRALRFLKDHQILKAIADHMDAIGYVGEGTNKTIGYLVGISRKLDVPLSMVILSPSGSGKSGLADALEALTPEEEFVSLSSITAQALYYMPKDKLRRKFILIEERAGSIEADYSIRALQSKKKLTRAVPIKDPSTGKIETKIFEILGPAAFLETTTESRINVENSTRCFEIHLDESREQTERIQKAQRHAKTFLGLWAKEERGAIVRLHHDAQRLLRTVSVVIPYADAIEFPTAWLRTRRDNLRFLHLIEVLAFLRQYQRPLVSCRQSAWADQVTDKPGQSDGSGRTVQSVQPSQPFAKKLEDLTDEELKEVVVIATLDDYSTAYELAGGLLGETLLDLKKPERDFFELIRANMEELVEAGQPEDFSRREMRDVSGLPQHRVRELFETLLDLEYIEPVRSSRGSGVRYRLTQAAQLPEHMVPGLLSPEALARKLDELEKGSEKTAEGAESVECAKRATH